MKKLIFIILLLLILAAPAYTQMLNPNGKEASEAVLNTMAKYGIEAGELTIVGSGFWKYESANSIVVAFETSERSPSKLEWGTNDSYGNNVTINETHYIHVFYLTDLVADQDYHIRFSAERDFDGQSVTSDDILVATKTIANAVLVPDDIGGEPPYILDAEDTYYLLTEDIRADSSGIMFTGRGSTLDLGGHTIIYNELALKIPTHEWTPHRNGSSFGIKMRSAGENMKIFNGRIMQGAGRDTASYVTIGFNPIYVSGGAALEIAGLEIIYEGVQITGIYCHYPGENMKFHHNIIDDRGKYIIDRHQQVSGIKAVSPGGGKFYNNLLRRVRQSGFGSVGKKCEVHNNEINIESYSINSFAIGIKDSSKVYDNKIFGCGNNAYGVASTSCEDVEIYNNYIRLHAHDLTRYKPFLNPKDMESAEISTMSAVRMTWGGDRISYHDNIILTTAREGGITRGTFFYASPDIKDCSFENNLVLAIAEDEETTSWGAIGGVGANSVESLPILFKNNTIVSNFTNYSMKDTYGYSNNYIFENNLFVKIGDRDDYATIRSNEGHASRGAVFIDSEFEGGAGFHTANMSDYSSDNFTVKWTLTVEGKTGAEISIIDNLENEVYIGSISEGTTLQTLLTEFFREKSDITLHTPHKLIAVFDGKTEEHEFTMDSMKTIYLFDDTHSEET
ncbi:MAG: hypothetical protein KAH48_10720, partial [Chlorobi bacterium]|nr:hypothetical protein [Chlorobiota bacterium]